MEKLTTRPNPLASFEEKLSDEYGLKIAKTISGEWFNGGMLGPGSMYSKRREYVRNKRLFVRGEYDADYFKNHFAKYDSDLDYINLDWTQINWAEKFSRIVSNGISDEHYKLKVTSIDALSKVKRKKKEDYYKSYIANKELLKKFKEILNLDMFPKGDMPDDDEGIDLFLEVKDRPKIEISEEILIRYIKESNDWNVLHSQWRKDFVDIGMAVARVWIDKNDGVKIDYVDPEFYIHSPVKSPNFKDKYYDGYVEQITLSDLKRESGFDEKTLREIAKVYSGRYNNYHYVGMDYTKCDMDNIIDYKIDVLRFAWKTSKSIKYKFKKRNGKVVKATPKDENYVVSSGDDFKGMEKVLDTWLEGSYVIGTNFIYNYDESENLFNDIMNKSVSSFIAFAYDMYEGRLRSFTDNIEAPARQLQKIHLKIQHLISELKPDIIEIDLDMLAHLDDGKGGSKRAVWQTALELMGAKGVVFKKRIDIGEEGGVKDESAVKTYPHQQGSALEKLLGAWAHYYNLIRESTGVNPARDGSMPSNALVGVNQMAQLASNTVTKNIVESAVLFDKKICEVISTRVHTIFNYKDGKELQELYSGIISKQLIDAVEILKDRHLHEFGFIFEMAPTEEELVEFNKRLDMAVQEGFIDVDIVTEASNIAKSNVKMALRYLMYMRKKRRKEQMEEQMMLSQNKSENDAMAARTKVEAETMAYQEKKKVDLWFEQQKAEIEIMKKQALNEIDLPVKEREFREKAYLKQLEGDSIMNKEKYREDRKDERLNKQSTQQSKLIEQRQLNTPPVDFEERFNQDLVS